MLVGVGGKSEVLSTGVSTVTLNQYVLKMNVNESLESDQWFC